MLVTGAAGLIGAACVDAFVAAGARVTAVDMAPITRDERDGVLALEGHDLGREADVVRAFDATEARFGAVTAVVHCAAVYGRMPFLELTAERIDHVLGVNVRATLLVGREAGRRMAPGGSVVNLTSISGIVSHGDSVVYEASKGAVTMATKSMANVLASRGIRVNAVAPGVMIKAQEVDGLREPTDLDDYERRRIPLKRFGRPEEIASVALFLSSPAAAYMTGSVVYADGGAVGTWATEV